MDPSGQGDLDSGTLSIPKIHFFNTMGNLLLLFLLLPVISHAANPNVVFVMTDDQGYGDLEHPKQMEIFS